MNHNQDKERFLLGFDFGGTKMAIATADVTGHILERRDLSTIACGNGPTALQEAINAAKQLADQMGPERTLSGIGISSMGITFPDRVEMAPNVPGWETLRIEETVRRELGEVPIRIENDVKAATLAELRLGALHGTDVGLYLNLGTGIALGFTVHDQVIRGHNGAAGEIAYALRHKQEEQGFRQGRAPLEEFVGGGAIGRRATEHFGRPLTTKELFGLAEHDSDANEFLTDTLEEIAYHLTNLVINWNPQKVVIGGGMVGAKDVIFPLFHRYFQDFVPFPPVVEVARFDKDAGLFGAIELATDAVLQ